MRKHLRKIALLSLFVMSMAFLYGCNTNTPSDTVDTFLNEIKKGENADPKIVGNVLEGTINSISSEENVDADSMSPEVTKEFANALKKINHKINSETIEGNTATVNVTVTGPDIGTAIITAFQKLLSITYSGSISGVEKSDEEMNAIYNQHLLESLKNMKYVDQVGDILLEKQGDKWVIINSNELTELLFSIDLSKYDQIQTPQVPEPTPAN